MKKREFLRGLSLLIGGTAAAHLTQTGQALSVALAYDPNPHSTLQDGQVLDRVMLEVLHDVCEQVIPASDTPSADEVDVHGFIDNQLAH